MGPEARCCVAFDRPAEIITLDNLPVRQHSFINVKHNGRPFNRRRAERKLLTGSGHDCIQVALVSA
jgi:hypothetical protein